ncbi:MAG: DUF1214 domain-containing protein [Methylobacteriaceae bacterium]|nr:DUF1214 domain-containing protein [Methylobacteriaceae bacterium]
MLNLIKLALTLAVGAALGLGATVLATRDGFGFGAVRAGPWIAWPHIGSSNVDPYARAALSRTGQIPLGLAEGLTFLARTDDAGNPLFGNCTYRIGDPMPPGRYWTLTANTPAGFLIDNPAKHYGFTSQEIVRSADGKFEIVVGRSARPGNWLPMGDVAQFTLVLRIYDTPLSATAATLDRNAMPAITRDACS